eukprot:13644171-Heterocapsa_arctica.AAC.1
MSGRGGPRCARSAAAHGSIQLRARVASEDARRGAGLQTDGSLGGRVLGHLIGSRLGKLCAHGCGTCIVACLEEEVGGNINVQ